MSKHNIKSKKGFTIIEVVLVLAIAGLIFLMVFVAYPALQRAQHDTQRTDDMGNVQAALIRWQNNHSNNLPGPPRGEETAVFDATSDETMNSETGEFAEGACGDGNQACLFVRDYMNGAASSSGTGGKVVNTFKDPAGEYYNVVITRNIAGNGSAELTNVNFENGDYDAIMTLIGNSTDGYTLEGQIDAYAMFIIPGATCKEDHAFKSSKNNFAVLYHMEGSGVKCTNNGS